MIARIFSAIVLYCALAGVAAVAAEPVTIPEIQGTGSRSALVGEIVKTTGIVTAKRRTSEGATFYVQDLNGDGDPATSDAIAVVAPTASANVGDLVNVEGRVAEWAGGRNHLTVTMISPGVIISMGNDDLPPPIVLGRGGIALPTEAIAGPGGAIELLETLEGMRVRVVDAHVVGPTNSFHEFWIVPDDGLDSTGINAFGGITATETDANPERLQVQLIEAQSEAYQMSVGEGIAEIIGVLDYSFGNFEIVATSLSPVVQGTPVPEAGAEVTAADLTIGSYNVENLDAMVENEALLYARRDRDDDAALGRFATIATHIVQIMGGLTL